MGTFVKQFQDTEESLTFVFDSHPDSDIEAIFESILAYKRLIQKSVFIATGEEIDLRQSLDEIIFTLEGHEKGSDIFKHCLKLVPKNAQSAVLVGLGVLLSAQFLLNIANQSLDLFIKWQQLTEVNDLDERVKQAEELLKEHHEKLDQLMKDQHTGSGLIYCPTPSLKILDFTEGEFNNLVKPVRDGNAKSVTIFQGQIQKFKFTPDNTKSVDLSFLNEREVQSSKLVRFEQASITNPKEWRVYMDGHNAVKAIIKDREFFSRINKIENNIFNPSYNVDMTEHWKRQKGEPELALAYVEINKVDFGNPVRA